MIVYLARDIPVFVMYCVNGESGSSLLIESTDSDSFYRIVQSWSTKQLHSLYLIVFVTTMCTDACGLNLLKRLLLLSET